MLYLFDIDGTVASERPGPILEAADYYRYEVLPGRYGRISALIEQGFGVAFVTNQSAVGRGIVEVLDFRIKMAQIMARLGFDQSHRDVRFWCRPPYPEERISRNPRHAYVFVEFAAPAGEVSKFDGDPLRRKPAPTMILEALKVFSTKPEETVFVGNADTDRAAAESAGVKFAWALEFFA